MVLDDNRYRNLIVLLIVFGILFIVMGVSYAFFSYSRSVNELIIKTGELEFAMLDGESVTLVNAFPESDIDGNKNNAYRFAVTNTSTDGFNVYYNLSFITNNNDEDKSYFTNDQIKYTLVKNNIIVKNSQLLSSVDGLNAGESIGEGVVLSNQLITAKQTDSFKLIMWISDGVDYSSIPDENGLSVGSYNGYEYSLKVKVDASNNKF